MPHEDAVDRLPPAYQQVLAWLDAGRSRVQIAVELGVDIAAVETLEQLARAKLARLERTSDA